MAKSPIGTKGKTAEKCPESGVWKLKAIRQQHQLRRGIPFLLTLEKQLHGS